MRAYDPSKHGLAAELGIQIEIDLESVFSQSDFVSIHVPLNKETRGMIDRNLLERMKKTAYLINTARGAVVNQHDLYEVLRDRRIAGAGLDVFDPEPPLPGEALPNVVVSPHTGGITAESNYRMATAVAKKKCSEGVKRRKT
ncbi:NAD(P)-dependent oxidoreductase [Terrilactibacillus sp. S3-3]|nr:NAD(P)-dependent oxidoreductase [Terrilactibacillus sp. S3-3]